MHSSLKAFMEQIIDYAGLFPPANLTMVPAIHNFVKYRKEPDAWMLSCFICPASRLEELSESGAKYFADDSNYPFSILASGGNRINEMLEHLKADIANVTSFLNRHSDVVSVDLFESRLPQDIYQTLSMQKIETFFEDYLGVFDHRKFRKADHFFEASFKENWEGDIAKIIHAISNFNERLQQNQYADYNCRFGFKLRCGGVEPQAFPATEKVTYVIKKCHETAVPFKATAGLHHPLRHYNASVQTKMHGFLNLFIAALLTFEHNLNRKEISEIINDEMPKHFSFNQDGLSWNEIKVSIPRIREGRKLFAVSFGSCSFDEPREDLQNLGLIN